MEIKNIPHYARKSAGKWALLAAAAAFVAPALWAQRDLTISPLPATADFVPSSLSISPASATSSSASSSLSTIRVPQNLPDKPAEPIGVERLPSRKSWMILSAVQHGAAAFDAYTTRQAIETGATEQDPFLRPFAGSPAIYAAIQVGPVLLDYTAREMQRSRFGLARKLWWVPQTVSTAAFIASGTHNIHVANRP